jgi:hypothetical protein
MNALQYNFPAPLFLFVLLAVSCVLPWMFALSPLLTGLLLLGWGLLSLARCLWVLETAFLFEDADREQRSRILPWLILSGMDLRTRLDTGFAAMRAADKIVVICFMLGTLYCAWTIFVGMTPLMPDAAQLAGAQIINFFEQQNYGTVNVLADPRWLSGLSHVAKVAMIGLCFWMVRSYALTLQKGRMMLIVCGLLFILSVLGAFIFSGVAEGPAVLEGSWKGYGPGLTPVLISMGVLEELSYSPLFLRSAEIGLSGVVFLYMPAALIGFALLKNCFLNPVRRVYALAGLGVLAGLLLADIALGAGPATFSLFISGWALISVLWQFSISPLEKTYNLRQL